MRKLRHKHAKVTSPELHGWQVAGLGAGIWAGCPPGPATLHKKILHQLQRTHGGDSGGVSILRQNAPLTSPLFLSCQLVLLRRVGLWNGHSSGRQCVGFSAPWATSRDWEGFPAQGFSGVLVNHCSVLMTRLKWGLKNQRSTKSYLRSAHLED